MATDGCHGALCCSGAVGALLVVLAALLQVEKAKYTPLYREIVCSPVEYALSGVSLIPLVVNIGIHIRCVNPNEYALRAEPWGTGLLWIGDDFVEVGTSEIGAIDGGEIVLPGASGGQDGWGTLALKVALEDEAISPLLANGIGSEFQANFELKAKIRVIPDILGILSVELTDLTVNENCAMMARLSPTQTGDVICNSSFETLRRPDPIGANVFSQFASFTIPEEEIRDGEQKRDAYLDVGFAVSLVFGLCGLAVPAAYMLYERRCHKDVHAEIHPIKGRSCEPDPSRVGDPNLDA